MITQGVLSIPDAEESSETSDELAPESISLERKVSEQGKPLPLPTYNPFSVVIGKFFVRFLVTFTTTAGERRKK